MSVSTKLITALAGAALLAAGMVAVNLWGAIVQLEWALVLAMLLCLAWAFFLALSLANGLKRIAAAYREEGATPTADTVTGDELAAIDALLSRSAARYGELASAVTQGLGDLVAQSTGLSSLVGQINEQHTSNSAFQLSAGTGIKTLSDEAAAIANRFEGLNTRMDTVTSTAHESAEQVGIIIGATEKMGATIASIAINAEKARGVAGTAVANVNAASNRVDELGAAALEISKVTDVIVEIAEQTKLLALNATIEAARAGEAGKGFAVVANEVKELALQTNNAIAEIRNKVEAMQHSTDNTIAEIGAINQTIKAVNEIVVTIAGAVEEQSIPTRDIVRQLNQGVSGINTIWQTVDTTSCEVRETAVQINRIATVFHELAGVSGPDSQQGDNLLPLLSSIKQQIGDLQSAGEGLLSKVKALHSPGQDSMEL
jgi:methyl-accepting chemotaxis protein